nr:unnamed protein product [Callosobruchus chinensis]
MSHLSSPEPDSSRLRLTTSLQNTSERNNIESSLYHELSCQGDELSMVSVASELDNAAEVAETSVNNVSVSVVQESIPLTEVLTAEQSMGMEAHVFMLSLV